MDILKLASPNSCSFNAMRHLIVAYTLLTLVELPITPHMKKYLQYVRPQLHVVITPMKIVALVLTAACCVYSTMADQSSVHSVMVLSVSEAVNKLSKRNDAFITSETLQARSEANSLVLDAPKKVNKLRMSKDALLLQTDIEIQTLKANRTVQRKRVDSEIETLEATKRIRLTQINEELSEIKVNPRKIFDVWDTNNDGELSLQEFKSGTKHPKAENPFNDMDADDDGILSYQELEKGFEFKASIPTHTDE